MARALS